MFRLFRKKKKNEQTKNAHKKPQTKHMSSVKASDRTAKGMKLQDGYNIKLPM